LLDIGGNATLVGCIRSLKELHTDFSAFESRVFLFNRPRAIPRLYFGSNNRNERLDELSTTARQLVSLCLTLNEYPHIRYQASNQRNSCSYDLARLVEDDLKGILRSSSQNWKPLEDSQRGTLLIVDRTLDPVAPLMHEYTYQAMVQDLLPLRGEILRLDSKESVEDMTFSDDVAPTEQAAKASDAAKPDAPVSDDAKNKTLVLSEDDELWKAFRHRHIGEVIQEVNAKFREFRTGNAMAQFQQNRDASINSMRSAMRDLPQYKELIRKYYKHMTLADQCMKIYDAKQLELLSELEQDMATGLDNDGNKLRPNDIKRRFTALLHRDDIGTSEKIRLLMIYYISQGSITTVGKEMYQAAGVNLRLESAISKLAKLGIDLTTPARKAQSKLSKERQAQFKDRIKNSSLKLMRFVPVLHEIANGLVSETLSRDKFPYLIEPPPSANVNNVSRAHASDSSVTSLRKGTERKRGMWHPTGDDSKDTTDESARKRLQGPRLIIYVLGGVTHSEIRSVYEIASANHNITIGSTEILTANTFLRSMANVPDDMSLKQVIDGELDLVDEDLGSDLSIRVDRL
jgi:syntaxin-binding protein 1